MYKSLHEQSILSHSEASPDTVCMRNVIGHNSSKCTILQIWSHNVYVNPPIIAHKILREMGGYHALVNNCQDFCQKLAKDLDCTGVLCGAEVAAGVAVAGGGGAGAVAVVGVLVMVAVVVVRIIARC